jgi:hypothetical protein
MSDDGAQALLHHALLEAADEAALRKVVRAACACAREALVAVPAGEARPHQVITAAERWADGSGERADATAAAAAAQLAAKELLSASTGDAFARHLAERACHAAAACGRAVLALSRPPAWKAIIAEHAAGWSAEVCAGVRHPLDPDAPLAAQEERKRAFAAELDAQDRRLAMRVRAALEEAASRA